MIDIDQRVPVDAAESWRCAAFLKLPQGLRSQVTFFRRDDPDQIAVGFKGQHLIGIQQQIFLSRPGYDPPGEPGPAVLRDLLQAGELFGGHDGFAHILAARSTACARRSWPIGFSR